MGQHGDGTVVVIGEALVDLVADGEGRYRALPGGSPANVAVGLARLGVPVTMAARLAADPLGEVLRGHLAGNGVGLEAVVRAAQPSSLALVHRDDAGQPHYDLRLAGTSDFAWATEELAGALPAEPLAVHLGSLAAILPPGGAAIEEVVRGLRGRVTISYDPNARPDVMDAVGGGRERAERLLALADVVKLSDEDLAWLRPGETAQGFARGFGDAGHALVAVTRGARGAVLSAPGRGVVEVPARPVERVVDTIGAGDSYQSALLAGLRRRGMLGAPARAGADALRALGAEAAAAAALTCSRAGANPPTAAELAAATSASAPTA